MKKKEHKEIEAQEELIAATIEAIRSVYRVPIHKQKELLVVSSDSKVGVSISPIVIEGRKFKTEFGKILMIGILESFGIPDDLYQNDSTLSLGERNSEVQAGMIRYKKAYHSIMGKTVDDGSEKGLMDFYRYHRLVMVKINNIIYSKEHSIMPIIYK